MSDNFRIDISTEGREALGLAMKLAFSKYRAASHYRMELEPKIGELREKPQRLILYWTGGAADALVLPFKLDAESATDFAWNWLREASYTREPDHDGDNGKGFRVYNEAWGHVDGAYQAIVAIETCWMMYGK